ncbi:MAG: GGDEF domain-containing protein [Leptothrix sp. (in: Bacteria)]|nr:GGDEF domain-containing protein [Leptothrix sp. (in: b-proteobacteria)]
MRALPGAAGRAAAAAHHPGHGPLCRAGPAAQRRSHRPAARPRAPLPGRAAGCHLPPRLPAAQPAGQGQGLGRPVPGRGHPGRGAGLSDDAVARELAALRATVAQFALLCNNVPAAIAYYEREHNTCRYANRGYAEMFGQTEASIIGLSVAQVIGEEAAAWIRPQVDQVLRQRQGTRYERRLPDVSGTPRYLEVHLLPHMPNGDDEPVGAFVLISDITRHREAAIALRDSEERLAKFMHASAEGIVFHRGGFITDANPPLLALLGHTLPELLGRSTLEFVAPSQRGRVAEVMAAGDEISYDSAVLHRDGHELPVEFIVRTMQYQGERLRMTIVRDMRDRAEAQARIHHLAHHDALTGLPNRLAFDSRAQALLARAQAQGEGLALLFIDLDHFKRVNDSLGHPVGDMLLQTVAERIGATLRAQGRPGPPVGAAPARDADLVARFGGDEFVLLLAGDPAPAAVQAVAAKLLAAIGAPLQVEGVSISVTPSIGVALYPAHGDTPAALLKHADIAMYRAKLNGRAAWRFFEPAMAETAYAELAMESRLAQAVREGEFVLHFQPQQSLADGRLLGIEALVRWQHPELGLVPPDQFIPLAEARRLILPIGQWVLLEALRCAVRWHASGLARVPVAINLSTTQFHLPGFAETVERALHDTGASGSMLELELTERMLMEDVVGVRAALQRLKATGMEIAIDDFGTGYTSLALLKHLPVDRLKIDRSFITDLPGDASSAAIADAIIRLGQSLGLQVVAEGVETVAQREWAREHGCDAMQGFFGGEPMAQADFERWLALRDAS